MSALDLLADLFVQLPQTEESAQLRVQAQDLIDEAARLERKQDRKLREKAAVALVEKELERARAKLQTASDRDEELAQLEARLQKSAETYSKLEAKWLTARAEVTQHLADGDDEAALQAQAAVTDIEALVKQLDAGDAEIRPRIQELIEQGAGGCNSHAELKAQVAKWKKLASKPAKALAWVESEMVAEKQLAIRREIERDVRERKDRELAERMVPVSMQQKLLQTLVDDALASGVPIDPLPVQPEPSQRLHDVKDELVAAQHDRNVAADPSFAAFWQ